MIRASTSRFHQFFPFPIILSKLTVSPSQPGHGDPGLEILGADSAHPLRPNSFAGSALKLDKPDINSYKGNGCFVANSEFLKPLSVAGKTQNNLYHFSLPPLSFYRFGHRPKKTEQPWTWTHYIYI